MTTPSWFRLCRGERVSPLDILGSKIWLPRSKIAKVWYWATIGVSRALGARDGHHRSRDEWADPTRSTFDVLLTSGVKTLRPELHEPPHSPACPRRASRHLSRLLPGGWLSRAHRRARRGRDHPEPRSLRSDGGDGRPPGRVAGGRKSLVRS